MSTETFAPLAYPVLSDPDRDLIEEKARTRGHAAGYAAGMADARSDAAVAREMADQRLAAEAATAREAVERTIALANRAAAAMSAAATPVLETLEHQVAAAALEIAEALIGRELIRTEDSAASALMRALNPEVPATVSVVRLNPEDLSVLTEVQRGAIQAELVADPALSRGDAIAEYQAGILDARLGTAVARLRAALAGDGQ